MEEKNKIDKEKNKEKHIIDKLKHQTKDDIGDKDMKMLVYDLYHEATRDDFTENNW